MSNTMVQEIAIPTNCSLYASAYNTQSPADFADCFATLVPRSDLTALQIYAAVARQTPAWVDALMAARNRVVGLLGLKNIGAITDVPEGIEHKLQPGHRLGIFSFVRATPTELVVEDADKHLVVQLAVLKEPHSAQHDRLSVTTVVHIHNMLGRLYMLPVARAHKFIVPAVLRQASAAIAQAS
jgi:hypothetical protein